jgi:hypothetical protein
MIDNLKQSQSLKGLRIDSELGGSRANLKDENLR